MQRKPRRKQKPRRPRLTERQILYWVDDHHEFYGKWPNRESGRIRIADDTWTAVNVALCHGNRGLPGGSSLAQLLAARRGVRNRMRTPRLTTKQVLNWVRQWQQRTGHWPTTICGRIPNSGGETWGGVSTALFCGTRGLPGGSSLPRLLEEKFGVPNPARLPRISIKQIVVWADAHRAATGRWPTRASGPVAEHPVESWSKINTALIVGLRGLPGGSSLAQLLARRRGVRNLKRLPKLTCARILGWARQYIALSGRRPTHLSGPVIEAGKDTGETWGGINAALNHGGRGLPGNDSLFQLLKRHGLSGGHPNSSVVVARQKHR